MLMLASSSGAQSGSSFVFHMTSQNDVHNVMYMIMLQHVSGNLV